MAEKQPLKNPTNRIVCVIDEHDQAEAAREELSEHGFSEARIHVLEGEETAEKVDTSAKWFADTDVEIERYERELRAGHCVLTVPIQDREAREKAHEILKRCNARLITHFGEWVTKMLT